MDFAFDGGAFQGVAFFILAILAATVAVLAARNREKWFPKLDEIVTLDARGWRFVANTTTAGAFILIGVSQVYGTFYWTGLAIEADGRTWPTVCDVAANCQPREWWRGWIHFVSVLSISAVLLSVVFEMTADLGTPWASGMKAQGKKATPEVLIVATILALGMAVISKWGIYEDARNFRASEAAQYQQQQTAAQARYNESQAVVTRLADAPSKAIATEQRTTIASQLETLRASKADAEKSRDAIPETHSTNRLAAQGKVDDWADKIIAKEGELLQAKMIEEDAAALAEAKTDRREASEDLEELAGKLNNDHSEVTRIGDSTPARVIRVALHQLLCFIFPILALDARTIARAKEKQEEANRRRSETMREKSRTMDADYYEPDQDAEATTPFGGYLNEPDRTEDEDAAEAEVEEPEDEDQDDETEFEPPEEDEGDDDDGGTPNA